PASNAGTFAVFDPAGVQIGTATVAVAFDGQVKFTIADGATDFVAGDGFTVTVANEGETWTELDPDATDGSEVAAGLLYAPVDATDAALPGVAVVREAEVKSACLVWPAGITDAQKAAALAELEFLGVFAR
ncbi:MAG: head decoration protein, partial [Tistlia sp.]